MHSAVALELIVDVFSVITIAINVFILVPPQHILSPLCNHIHELQLVTRISVELTIDDSTLSKNEFDRLGGHPEATEKVSAWHITVNQLAILVHEHAWAMLIIEVFNALSGDRFDELYIDVLSRQSIHMIEQNLADRYARRKKKHGSNFVKYDG